MTYPIGNRIKPVFIAGAIALSTLGATTAIAGIEETMEEKWGAMINTTDSSTISTQTRGVLNAGSFSVKTGNMNINPFSINTPSIRAGCGGIDMYGGSFSMINKDQFVQALRRIASNAVGYSFQLAMDSMCPTCSQTMQKLQGMVNEANKHLSNSCQAATSFVNATSLDEASQDFGAKVNDYATKTGGYVTDWFEGQQQGSSENQTQAQTNTPAEDTSTDASKKINANVVMKALNGTEVASWFAAGDEELKETMMSVTGSAAMMAGSDKEPTVIDIPPVLSVEELMEGGTFEIYDCPNDDGQCLPNPDTGELPMQEIEFTGMRERTLNVLLPNDGSTNTVVEVIMGRRGSLTGEQERFLESVPIPLVGALHRFGQSTGVGHNFISASSQTIAVLLVEAVVNDILTATSSALANTEASGMERFRDGIWQERKAELRRDVLDLEKPIDDGMKYFEHYRNIMESLGAFRPPEMFVSGT